MHNDFWTNIIFKSMNKLDKKTRLQVLVALVHGAILLDGYTEADIFDLKDKTAEAANIIADYHNLGRAGSEVNKSN